MRRTNLSKTSSSHHSSDKSRKEKPSSSQKPSVAARPHICHQCDKPFYKQEQLKRHIRLVHENWRPFKCLFCEVTFGTKQNLHVHFSTRKHRHRTESLEASNPKLARELSIKQHHLEKSWCLPLQGSPLFSSRIVLVVLGDTPWGVGDSREEAWTTFFTFLAVFYVDDFSYGQDKSIDINRNVALAWQRVFLSI